MECRLVAARLLIHMSCIGPMERLTAVCEVPPHVLDRLRIANLRGEVDRKRRRAVCIVHIRKLDFRRHQLQQSVAQVQPAARHHLAVELRFLVNSCKKEILDGHVSLNIPLGSRILWHVAILRNQERSSACNVRSGHGSAAEECIWHIIHCLWHSGQDPMPRSGEVDSCSPHAGEVCQLIIAVGCCHRNDVIQRVAGRIMAPGRVAVIICSNVSGRTYC